MPQPSRSVSLRDLISDGTTIQPHEAVTIVQQVCRYLAWKSSLGEAVCVPPIEEIRIDAAGEAAITDLTPADAPLSVLELARLLESLLPPPSRDQRRAVPGPLRFAIARALGDVDARAFASAAEFSAALARFERDAPRQAIGALFDRWCGERAGAGAASTVLVDGQWAVDAEGFRERRQSDAPAEPRVPPPVRVERRRSAPRADTFRLLLREADQRVFESSAAAPAAVQPAAAPDARVPPGRDRRARTPDAATFRRLLREADRALYERRVALSQESAPPSTASEEKAEPAAAVRLVAADLPAERTPIVREAAVEHARLRSNARSLAAAALLLLALAIPVGWRATRPVAHPAEQRAGAAATPPAETSTIGTTESPAPQRPEPAADDAGTRARRPAVPGPDANAERATSGDATPQLVLASNDADRALFSPSFATSGSAVFFHSGNEHSALMRGDTSADGAVLHVTSIVDDGAKNYHVRLSPDGKAIAFDSDRDGERGVYIATREGKSVRRVSRAGFAAVPSWSPDGRQLAFVRAEPDQPTVWNLWLHEVATGDERRLTSYAYGQPWGGSWFSDGRRICYSHEDAIYVLDLTTGAQKRYPSPIRGRLARTPAVSPDGRRVVFQVRRDGVWLLDLADGSMRRILNDPTAEEFTWSPDGRRVAFHSQREGGWALWMVGM